MNKFFRKKDGFYTNNITYSETDLNYIGKKYLHVLGKAKLVEEELCQGKKNYKKCCMFYGLFLAPKIKYCLTIDKHCIIQEQKKYEGLNANKKLLVHSQFFRKK